jgi:hypothetical protein
LPITGDAGVAEAPDASLHFDVPAAGVDRGGEHRR